MTLRLGHIVGVGITSEELEAEVCNLIRGVSPGEAVYSKSRIRLCDAPLLVGEIHQLGDRPNWDGRRVPTHLESIVGGLVECLRLGALVKCFHEVIEAAEVRNSARLHTLSAGYVCNFEGTGSSSCTPSDSALYHVNSVAPLIYATPTVSKLYELDRSIG